MRDVTTNDDKTPRVDAPTEWGTPRSRLITWYDPRPMTVAGATMNGVDFLRAIRDGRFAPPPMASVFGFRITDIDVGKVGFECTPDESAYNTLGMVHGGLVCTLADTVVGCAVHSTLDPGLTCTSIDLHVSYLRPVTMGSGVLRAIGEVTKPGRRVAFASAEVRDGGGRLVATATSSLLIMPTAG